MGTMRRRATAVAAAVTATAVPLAAPAASADTGACVSYLEDQGVDTSVRVQWCANTETIGDLVSQEIASPVCMVVMAASFLPHDKAKPACELALKP